MLNTRIYILRGPSGSGKTTFAEKALRPLFHHFEVVSADRFFIKRGGEYKFDLDLLSEAHRSCYENYKMHLNFMYEHSFRDDYYEDDSRYSAIVVDNTNIEAYEIAPYWMEAYSKGQKPFILTFNSLGSVNDHVLRNVHGLTAGMIGLQMKKFESAQLPSHWRDHCLKVHHTREKFQWEVTHDTKEEEAVSILEPWKVVTKPASILS